MAIEKYFTAKTVDDATEAGLKELGLSAEEVKVEVITEGKKGLFGIGAVPAKVKLTFEEKDPTQAAPVTVTAPVSTPKTEEKDGMTDGERAVKFLDGLFPFFGKEGVKAVLLKEGEKIEIDLQGENTKGIIGRRGEIIDAIQVLAGAVANTGREEYVKVVVDCGSYREEREATLRRVAEKTAAKAVRLGRKVRLEAMNPYERRIIHSALVDSTEVTTKSEGKEPQRFVVIIPNNLKPYEKRDDFRKGGRGKNYGGKGRNERNERSGDRKYGERKPAPRRNLPTESTPQSSGTSFKKDGGSARPTGYGRFVGTYLGNSKENAPEEGATTKPEETTEE